VKAEREANAVRQQTFRDRKKAEREAKKAAEEAARNAPRNAVTPDAAEPESNTTATRTRHDGDTNPRENRAVQDEDSQVSEFRNGVSNGTPKPVPSSVPPLEEQKAEKTASYEEPARIGDRPRIPEASQPLVDAITAAGMPVGWDIKPSEWFLIEALIKRCGIPALVISAKGSWQGAARQPRSGRYFIPAWRSLSDAPAETGPVYLPAAVGEVTHLTPGHRPATSDARFQQAVETGRRLQALADAKRNQEQQ
jgi:hypothetical protein